MATTDRIPDTTPALAAALEALGSEPVAELRGRAAAWSDDELVAVLDAVDSAHGEYQAIRENAVTRVRRP